MSKVKYLLTILAALSIVLLSQRAHASHFRYGNITYTIPDPANPRSVRFEVVAAWNPQSPVAPGTILDFGDGTQNPFTAGVDIGTGFDAAGLQYKFTKYLVSHTYAGTATHFIAAFSDCCRISTLINAHDANYKVTAHVDLTPGNTGNPRTFIPAIIQLQTGGVRSHFIPAADPDGTPTTCRFSTPTETGDPNAVIPGRIPATNVAPTLTASTNPPGCLLTWNTTGGVPGQQYATQVTLESVNPATNQINSAVIDYILELVQAPVPTCTGSGTFVIPMGSTFTTNLVGTNNAGGNSLKLTTIYSNGSILPVSGSTGTSPFTTTMTWSPSFGEAGTYLATVVFTDQKSQSGFCSLTLIVPPCPQFGQACSVGVGECKRSGFLRCDASGTVACNVPPGDPKPEVCDNLDNNCDGQVDEGNPEGGQACVSGFPGECSSGISSCAPGGLLQCIPDVTPGTVQETCNAKDDDCNGTVDDGFDVGAACSVGLGACKADGAVICDSQGGTTCNATAGMPQTELCNGIDDNCDGAVDEGFNLGSACSVGQGACKAGGMLICDKAGAPVCSATAGMPEAEVCGNKVDEDCDGALNNGCKDTDNDGLYDPQEIELGLDPNDVDSDDDGVPDGAEPSFSEDTDGDGLINALDPDSDNDGLFDGTELGLDCSHEGTDAKRGHCIADADQGATKTDPLKADTDDSSVIDGSEDWNLNGKVDADETDPNQASDDATVVDTDFDGLSDKLEVFLGSNPMDRDSDDDGVLDGKEANFADDTDGDMLCNVLDPDSDDDALFDGTEVGNTCQEEDTNAKLGHCRADGNHGVTKTSPVKRDTDGGGASDGSEDANLNGVVDQGELDPSKKSDDAKSGDSDKDGLSDDLEKTLGSKPTDADSDDDGLLDGQEANPSDDQDGDGKRNIVDADSDNDGLFDGTEAGKDCSVGDTSHAAMQCIADEDKGATRTAWLVADTDKGSALDGEEDANHNGVVDMGERDPLNDKDDILPPECQADADCGVAGSSFVCEKQKCVSGCRSDDTCPAGQVCDAASGELGTCKAEPNATGSTSGGDEGGCGCSTVGSSSDSLGWLLFVSGAAFAATRRRRDRRSST